MAFTLQLDSAFGYYNNALLNGLTSVIGNAQYSQRLQDMVKQMLSEHNTTIEHPNSMHHNISKMGGISKRGDRYLRKQLVHGARALVSIL